MFHSHLLTLIIFAVLVSVFFGALTRETFREGSRIAGVMFASIVGFSLLVAWLMYLFPLV
ncbi:MAG TPA: hypothetical protein VNI57_14495 [Candidatus Saccharimonadales bacterium]|nr:hypothetical protein [Candidatus Saccharimonadales bacterium]